MNSSSISVVIPAFNASQTITRAIDSCLSQTIPVTQIIVVDDGSMDDTAAIVRQYDSPVTLIQQTNSRTAAARNRGIETATGDFIAFLDADDYWESEKIEQQLSIFNKHPELNLVAGKFFCETPGAKRELSVSKKRGWYDRSLRLDGDDAFMLGTMLWTGTVMVRRVALQQQRFVSGLEPAEDRDLWIRLAANNAVYLDSKPLATAVLQPGSISRGNIAVDCSKMLEVIERNADLMTLSNRLFWKSYIHYRWAAIDPLPSTSLPILMRSFVCWPFPFWGMPAMKRWGRLKRLLFLLKLSLVRQNQPEGVL
ncbi:glycosyltransferase family 2 protein [Novipirellula sp. SH528]|uniref:glycosyltransferase family 2 protein n=1 Tax=Novipirellula sp. SH528 TaxID=3454466 RepID=UPI003FA0D6E4